MSADDNATVRADQWLWAARFFKTRRLSRDAIDGGKVVHNGVACKPARPIRVGDRLQVTRAGERLDIVVLGLSSTRGSAEVAQKLYSETEESRQARMAQRELRRLAGPASPRQRPDKHARRQLRRLKEGG